VNAGKDFEQQFQKSIPKDVYYLRIKDTANNFTRSSNSRFATLNPFDFLLFKTNVLFPFELKSTKGTSFSIQFDKSEKGKDIKKHQIECLEYAASFQNILSGFLFDFRNSNTYWLSIENFCNFLKSTNKKSINEKDVISHNGIVVEKKLLRVKYKYNIDKLLNDIVKSEG